MVSLPFVRFFLLNEPIVRLSQEQQEALCAFRAKLERGLYGFEETPCLCGDWRGKLIAQRDRYALPVNTYLCRSCGLMWTSPRMTTGSLARFYEEDYRPIYVGRAQAPEFFFAEQVRHGHTIYDFVVSDMPSSQGLTVFDVGCGAGGTLVHFLDAGWSVFGCDLGVEYLQRGRAAGLVLEHGDVTTLGRYRPANLVVVSHVLEHLPSPLEALKQISALMVDDGYLYAELPGIFSIHKTYGDTLRFLQNAHLYHFTLATLTSLMSRAGFRLVKGDERIHALFQRDGDTVSASATDQYRKILAYLCFAEVNRFFGLSRLFRTARRVIMRTIRHVFGDSFVDDVMRRWLGG